MTIPVPRASRKNTEHALRTLALIKLLQTRIRAAEKAAKNYLATRAILEVGDKKNVTDDQGESIATVSMSKGRTRGGLTVTDPFALADWCDQRGIQHHGQPSITFPAWFTAAANLQALVNQHGGQLPPGLSDYTEEGDPVVTTRQTTAQEDALLSNFTPAVQIAEALALPQAEEPTK